MDPYVRFIGLLSERDRTFLAGLLFGRGELHLLPAADKRRAHRLRPQWILPMRGDPRTHPRLLHDVFGPPQQTDDPYVNFYLLDDAAKIAELVEAVLLHLPVGAHGAHVAMRNYCRADSVAEKIAAARHFERIARRPGEPSPYVNRSGRQTVEMATRGTTRSSSLRCRAR